MDLPTPIQSPAATHGEEICNHAQDTESSEFSAEMPQVADYIALGCLVVDQFTSGLPSPPLRTRPLDHISNFDFPLRDAVSRLLDARWIRVFSRPVNGEHRCVLRVYVLPQDVGRSRFSVTANNKALHAAFEQVLMQIDTSPELWSGSLGSGSVRRFDLDATPENNSLWYIFNTLPSPAPSPKSIVDRYSRAAAYDLLGEHGRLKNLKTKLYSYQARSAAMMLQRESAPELILDPRLELRQSPDGTNFFYGPRDGSILKSPRQYETVRGGILAETMGLGKTVICIALILATKGHQPKIPGHCVEPAARRSQVGSLSQMAVATANRYSIPAKACLERRDDTYFACLDQLVAQPPRYKLPVKVARFQRNTIVPPPIELTLCSGTIIVVPHNLVHQWKLELRKHVCSGPGGLRVLILDKPGQAVPPADVLREYDIVLISRQRFEREIADGHDRFGRSNAEGASRLCRCPYIGASRKVDCTCLKQDDIYQSPLKKLHWLRLIVDEGHAFTSKGTNAVQVASKLIRAERRWIVSGTPARHHVYGVEVEAGSETAQRAAELHATTREQGSDADVEDFTLQLGADASDLEQARLTRRLILQKGKPYSMEREKKGAAQNLGQLASHFLKARPWAASEYDSERRDWDEHIFRHEGRGKTYSSFSLSLRRTLEAMVIKTQPEDVERDIVLPPLHHRTVYLEPCFYDKLTINLFVLVINGNAVTSERTDQDYLFHENGAKARNVLIKNLRQSAFFWTGFTAKMVTDALEVGERYLAKDETACLESDRRTLIECLRFARLILECRSWQALSRTHELGLFVNDWPPDSANFWALIEGESRTLTGISHVLEAQSLVNSQLLLPDPFMGLAQLGSSVLEKAFAAEAEEEKKQNDEKADVQQMELKMSTATTLSDISVAKRHYKASPSKATPAKTRKSGVSESAVPRVESTTPTAAKRKRGLSDTDRYTLPADSPVRLPVLVGTTSAKLSYLIDQVVAFQDEEKILIFYDGDDIAYYLAQYLDLLHSTYLIYAKSLSSEQKAKYIVAFDENPRIRVMVMDVHCGAEGLNINKASRVFFINPCCRPSTEAQAIKRSHRIGQTRAVHVETLVLKGTVEEAMFRRAKSMTNFEHHQVKDLADDPQFANVIQNARSIPMTGGDFAGNNKMAPLATPQQIFGRDGRAQHRIQGIDLDVRSEDVDLPRPKKRKPAAKERPKAEAVGPDVDAPTTPLRNQHAVFTGAHTVAESAQPPAIPIFSIFGGG